jgi:hypothetical protein
MSAPLTIFDEVYDYINNFQSYFAYENFSHKHYLENHRKHIQTFIHQLLWGYNIYQIEGMSFDSFKLIHI